MNIELIRKILSTKGVRYAAPDHFHFDFGVKISASEFDTLAGFKTALNFLNTCPGFTTRHLAELLEYLTD